MRAVTTFTLTCLVTFMATRPSSASQVDTLLKGLIKKSGGTPPVVIIMEKSGKLRPTGSSPGHAAHASKLSTNGHHKRVLSKVQQFVHQLQRSSSGNNNRLKHTNPHRMKHNKQKVARSRKLNLYLKRVEALRTLSLLRASVNCASNNIKCKQTCPEDDCEDDCDDKFGCDDKTDDDDCDDDECKSDESGGSTKGPISDECGDDYCD